MIRKQTGLKRVSWDSCAGDKGVEGINKRLKVIQNSVTMNESSLKRKCTRLPWWIGDEESTCQCRRHWFYPWSRKIPHDAERLCLCSTLLTALEPRNHNCWSPCTLEPIKTSHCNEKATQYNQRAKTPPGLLTEQRTDESYTKSPNLRNHQARSQNKDWLQLHEKP